MIGVLETLQGYLGHDKDGKPIDVVGRIHEACDRTRHFYLEMEEEMRGYLLGKWPSVSFMSKTGLSAKEFERRLAMLKIENTPKESDERSV